MNDLLKNLLRQGESETVEFKESLDNEALESISAFANTKGGTVLIGIRDNGAVQGVTLGKETLRDWANRISQATSVHPHIREVAFQGKTIVVIEVSESLLKPVPCKGRHYKRVGKSNRQMNDQDLTRAVLEKIGMTWDEVIEPRASLSDLDSEQMRRFRVLCSQKGRRSIPDDEDNTTVLEKLNLLKNGQLLRAAVLLFGSEPQKFYPQAKVKIGRFRSETLIVDDREISGSLFQQVENTMGYFREHLQTRFERHGEPAREVIWEYPLAALREAIINAVCHRDYIDFGQSQVRWFDEYLIVLNPGVLPASLRLEELKRGHRSVPRNRKIAEMFFYAGLIEYWGSGTLTIIRECKQAGLPEPEYEEAQGALWLTMRKDGLTEARLQELGLNERQITAVRYVQENGKITNKKYQAITQVSKPSATRDLTDLVAKNIFIVMGNGKRTIHYVLHQSVLDQNEPKMSQK